MRNIHFSRRIGTAAVIAGLHVAALTALLVVRARSTPDTPTALPPLTIVTLPQVTAPGPTPAGAAVRPPPPVAITTPFPAPALPALPALTPAAPDAAGLAALGEYLGCRLPAEQQTLADRERCAQILRELPVGPPLNIPLTEEEKALARKFDLDQRRLNAPMAVPCLMGAMISPLCVAATLLTGGDFIQTYADAPEKKREPLATGMVGRSGRPPGYP